MILIDIRGSSAVVRKQEILTTGMVGATVEFRFDTRWKGMTKTAVFRSGDVVKDVVISGSTAIIPHEVLVENGFPLEIGVYGTSADGEIAIPTIYAKTNQIKEGADPSGDESTDPTPGVYDQIMVELGTIRAENNAFTDETNEKYDAFVEEATEKHNAFTTEINAKNDAFVAEVESDLEDATRHNIASIEKTGTDGLVDTYTITFLDGSTQTYTVTNGEKGEKGDKGEKGEKGDAGSGSGGLTAEQVQAMIDAALAAIPNAEEASF